MKRLPFFNNIKNQKICQAGCLITSLVLFLSLLTSCSSHPVSTLDATQIFQDALLTATNAYREPTQTHTPTITPTPAPTETPAPTFTATATEYTGPPPTLPATFTSDILRPNTVPRTYIEDTCTYLKTRLDPNNSAPGTVVMAVMFHGIAADFREISDNMDVRHSDMVNFVEHAHEVGFETITTRELVNFLENNAKIPLRSLYIIVDDRRPGAVREHFMPYLQKYDWTLTLGWIIGDTDTRAASVLDCCPGESFTTLWEQMEAYNATGYLDIQSHGNVHNIPVSEASTEEYILSELNISRQVIQEHFYCKDYATGQPIENCQTDQPLAYIWPGGGFTPRAAELARESGYHVAFTTNPRGPIMYNWIPLAEAYDPATPSWLPEGGVANPLMVLPRYWSYDAAYRIDDVGNIGEQAAAYAQANRQAELDYYYYYCKDITGDIPLLNEENTQE